MAIFSIGGLLLLWIICAFLGGFVAEMRGGSAWGGFFLGLLLGPIGVIIAIFLGSESGRAERAWVSGRKKKCPKCAEIVANEALVCRYCGFDFVADVESNGRVPDMTIKDVLLGRRWDRAGNPLPQAAMPPILWAPILLFVVWWFASIAGVSG